MHDPSLGRGHRVKRDRPAPVLDAFRRTERQLLGSVEPSLLVALDIDPERDVVPECSTHHRGHDGLHIMQRRSTPSDQEPGIFSEQVEYDRAAGSVGIRIATRVIDVDFNLYIHQVEQVLDDLARPLGIIVIDERDFFPRRSRISGWRGVVFFDRDLNQSLFGAYAEDSSAALTKNDDVCVFEVDS